jgi:hypothetical protein
VGVIAAPVALVRVIFGLAAAELLRPVVGLQLYTRPATGAAPSWVVLPEQNVTGKPALATGSGFTVTVTVPVLTQLVALVTVKV